LDEARKEALREEIRQFTFDVMKHPISEFAAHSYLRLVMEIAEEVYQPDLLVLRADMQNLVQTVAFVAVCTERGLDPHTLVLSKERQQELFEKQVSLLRELGAENVVFRMTRYEPPVPDDTVT
jgi:hypothetical protein